MILAIDPGLDCVGWALFKPAAQPLAVLQDARPCLLASGFTVTKPDDRPDHIQIPARADQLVRAVSASLWSVLPLDTRVQTVLIEVPAAFGPYASRGVHRREKALGMARSMACLWYTIGRLDGHFGSGDVEVIRLKATGEKEANHFRVLQVWPDLPKTKTGPSEDQRDAVHLGLRFLLDRRRVAA